MKLLKKTYLIIGLTLVMIFVFSGNLMAYDLIVYNAEPEGVAAAVAAARDGLNTALVMEREEPGGLFTYGGLNFLDLNYDRNGNNINQGIFGEWHDRVGGGVSFNIAEGINAFNDLLTAEENLTLYRNHKLENINKNGRVIKYLEVKSPDGVTFELAGKYFIDESLNGDLTYHAGNPYFFVG